MGTDARGASNAKAKRELDAALSELAPGFPAVYSALRIADGPKAAHRS
jgi:hypothetical protein